MVSFNEAGDLRRKQVEKIKAWLRNKNVRQWKRVLFLLCETGESMNTQDVASKIGGNYNSVYRVLKKMRISSSISEVKRISKGRTRLIWKITNHGMNEVRRAQKNHVIPSFKII